MKIKYCDVCNNIIFPDTSSGELIFKCYCGKPFKADDYDSLRHEQYYNTVESDQKYETLLDISPFEPGGNKVLRECPKCGLNYMTKIYIGIDEKIRHVCSCGFME